MLSTRSVSVTARLTSAAPSCIRLARFKSSSADDTDELALLERLMKDAKKRKAVEAKAAAAAAAPEGGGNKFQIQTFNAISPHGLKRFPQSSFMLTGSSGAVPDGVENEPHSIMLRSHKLKTEEVGMHRAHHTHCMYAPTHQHPPG